MFEKELSKLPLKGYKESFECELLTKEEIISDAVLELADEGTLAESQELFNLVSNFLEKEVFSGEDEESTAGDFNDDEYQEMVDNDLSHNS